MWPKGYGLFNLVFDLIMLGLTGGLWFIWIIIREIRRTKAA